MENESVHISEGYEAGDFPARRGLIKVDIGEGNFATASCPRYSGECRTGKIVEAIIARRTQREKKQWLNAVDIPEKHRKVTRDGITTSREEICEYLDHWPVYDGHGIVLLGPKGTGKSGTLALIALEAFERGMSPYNAHFTTVTRLMFALCSRKEEAYWKGQLLLLDELGASFDSDYAFAIFEDYLNWRYERELTTCIGANLTPEQVQANERYSRIVDRWRETCDVVVMAGKSRRQPDTADMQEMRKAN